MMLETMSSEADVALDVSLESSCGPALWLNAYQRESDEQVNRRLVVEYLRGASPSYCMDLIHNDINHTQIARIFEWFLRVLSRFPLDELKNELRSAKYIVDESDANVPQISSYDAERLDILDVLASSDTPLTFDKLGYHLLNGVSGRSREARRKYGENAARFSEMLDLVCVGRGVISGSSKIAVRLSWIGRALQAMPEGRSDAIARLMLRSVLFRDLICADESNNYVNFIEAVDALSPITRGRRASAFSWMLRLFKEKGGSLDSFKKTEELVCHMRR